MDLIIRNRDGRELLRVSVTGHSRSEIERTISVIQSNLDPERHVLDESELQHEEQ